MGEAVGKAVGKEVGAGDIVGFAVGLGVGPPEGACEGVLDGLHEGRKVGAGEKEGDGEGMAEGVEVVRGKVDEPPLALLGRTPPNVRPTPRPTAARVKPRTTTLPTTTFRERVFPNEKCMIS